RNDEWHGGTDRDDGSGRLYMREVEGRQIDGDEAQRLEPERQCHDRMVGKRRQHVEHHPGGYDQHRERPDSQETVGPAGQPDGKKRNRHGPGTDACCHEQRGLVDEHWRRSPYGSVSSVIYNASSFLTIKRSVEVLETMPDLLRP